MPDKVKNKGGRPPLFKTDEELQSAINKYFNEGIKKRTFVIGSGATQREIQVEIPTITGLCYYIGFESRQSFYDYQDMPMFSYTIKRARLFIECEYEEQLQYGNTTGAIFALKNMGWRDKQDIEHSGTVNVDPFKQIRENAGIDDSNG